MFDRAPPPPPARPAGNTRNWGGRRAGAGGPRGPRPATLARIAELRARLGFDATEALFADLTPADMLRLSAWQLLAARNWVEAGTAAARLAPYHHHRTPRTLLRQAQGSPAPPPAAAPEPAPPAAPPAPIPSAGLSERANDLPSANLPDPAAAAIGLPQGAVRILAPHLNGEVIDPDRPCAHWRDAEIARAFLLARARAKRRDRPGGAPGPERPPNRFDPGDP